MSNAAFAEMMDHVKETRALSQVMAVLFWDQEAKMPAAAAAQRGDQIAA